MTAHRIIDSHSELTGIGTLTHGQIDSQLTGSQFLVVSGSSPMPQSARALKAGSNVVLTDNGPGGEFVISVPSASGLTEAQHEVLNTLAHSVVTSSYDVTLFDTSNRVTSYTVWTDASQTVKLQDFTVAYNAQRMVSAVTSSTYNPDGSVKSRVIEAPAYNSLWQITSMTRTKVV